MVKHIQLAHFVVALLVFTLPSTQTFAAMISTEQVVSDLASERARIQAFLEREEVEKKMVELGVSPLEATQRVASLSDTEVRSISGQLDQLPAGGDGIYIGLGGLILIGILLLLIFR